MVLSGAGGLGVGGRVNIGGNTAILSTTQSTSTLTGALIVRGGIGIEKDLFSSGAASFNGAITSGGGVATYTGQSPIKITTGTLSIGSVANGANVGPFSDTFPITYGSAPSIVGISQSGSGGENVHYMITPTTTGFSVRAKNSGNSASNVVMQWIAIGIA